MTGYEDPRLTATRNHAIDSAVEILLRDGVLAVTHGSVSKATGISRSTLYRHWPDVAQLRSNAFKRAAIRPNIETRTDGPLRADLTATISALVSALNDTPWGKIAPQVIAAAAADAEVQKVINDLMQERMEWVESIFSAAVARGEVQLDAPIRDLVEMTIAAPYFRKFIAGLPLSQDWLVSHVDFICRMAGDADCK